MRSRPAKRAVHRRRVVLMVKVPVAGRVKTRLAREVGAVRATMFYRHMLTAVAGRVQSPRWQTLLAVAPDTGVGSPQLPRLARVRQGAGDLGQRMQRLMTRLPPGPVIIIGSDIPGVTAAHIARAFRLLGSQDAVLGPAPDGGYWLVGFRRSPRVPRAFQHVRWSGPDALADTVRSLGRCAVGKADVLADVDDRSDLERLEGHAHRRVLVPCREGQAN